ncbi:MAG: bifunctional diaminohydroxyphosphoribosylaminopyrimidine deaminase/5-amino-6-(5-phosphoribosylamino)uracil reductase RibD, partial [Nitrosotalea sp.]
IHIKRMKFIAIKFAASLDGKIATKTGDSKWITNEKARIFARKLRLEYQAILVGINTVIHDNPHLGVRIKGRHDPRRVVLDSTLKIPLESGVLRDSNVLIVTTMRADKKKLQLLQERDIDVVSLPKEKITIPEVLRELKKREIVSVLVEGGGKMLGSFVDAKMVDKVYVFHAPIIIGGKHAVSAIEGAGIENVSQALVLENMKHKRFDTTMLTVGSCFDGLAF